MLDLFGHNVTPPEILERKKRNAAKGYPRPPGSGPKGETCKGCRHFRRKNGGSKDYFKCGLLQHAWNRSNTTDIRANSPACSLFEPSGAIRIEQLDARTINCDADPEIGELVEVDIPDVGTERFLRVRCGTGRTFALAVPPNMRTALEANAWTWGVEPQEYKPEVRT